MKLPLLIWTRLKQPASLCEGWRIVRRNAAADVFHDECWPAQSLALKVNGKYRGYGHTILASQSLHDLTLFT